MNMTTQNSTHIEPMWFIMKSDKQFGPYSYVDLLRMRQERQIYDFDYVWTQGLSTWMVLSSVPQFQSQSVETFIRDFKELANEAIQLRKNKRVQKQVSIYVHDNEKLWRGSTLTLSAGGASFMIENPKLIPGEIIRIHFSNSDDAGQAFNATAEIIGKKFHSQIVKANTIMTYYARFTNVNEIGKSVLKKWIGE